MDWAGLEVGAVRGWADLGDGGHLPRSRCLRRLATSARHDGQRGSLRRGLSSVRKSRSQVIHRLNPGSLVARSCVCWGFTQSGSVAPRTTMYATPAVIAGESAVERQR